MFSYKELSDDLLAGFFVEISRNIKKGILSKAMYHEIALIRAVAEKRKLSELDLKKIYLNSNKGHRNEQVI
ncbi:MULTISPECIES: hypothetical protein [unclassified Bacillus (in: firmicutes)]|uniref:hypothetical protein n=1 Tax=unclassified Bacillus (in: firmicutes) TaxID=185979 RepID=UPI003D245F23